MNIHVLMENTSARAEMQAEHGLSLLIESAGHRILFDAGASPAFAENAERMGLNLAAVDLAVLSHGHYDHGGGLPTFLQLNRHAPVWVAPHAFDPHFNANGKNIGLPPALAASARICLAKAPVHALAPGVILHRAADMPCPHAAEGQGMSAVIVGRHMPDDFRHEQYLLIEEAGKRILFSGCSHRGILNIAAYFRPHVLIGGFHYMKCTPEHDTARLQAAAVRLLQLPTLYYTGHCTGATATAILSAHMGERLRTFSAGDSFSL